MQTKLFKFTALLVFYSFILNTSSCTLTGVSTVRVVNQSSETIIAQINSELYNINPYKDRIYHLYPSRYELIISVQQINFQKKYPIDVGYLTDNTINFIMD